MLGIGHDFRYCEMDEVTSLAAFLCSDEASYMTGDNFRISGGSFMGLWYSELFFGISRNLWHCMKYAIDHDTKTTQFCYSFIIYAIVLYITVDKKLSKFTHRLLRYIIFVFTWKMKDILQSTNLIAGWGNGSPRKEDQFNHNDRFIGMQFCIARTDWCSIASLTEKLLLPSID